MHVACYCRVSDERQHIELQRDDIGKWLQRQTDDPKAALWFYDEETGRRMFPRPGLRALQAEIDKGQVHTVVVWKLDRLSRRQADGIQLLSRWFSQGVRVVSVTQAIDLSGVIGQTIAALLFGLAELELDYMRERQRLGIDRARAQGKYKGGNNKGHRKGDLQRVGQLKIQGLYTREIAEALGLNPRTVTRYLLELKDKDSS